MRTILKNSLLVWSLGCVALLFAACNDWTDPESAGVKGPSFPNDDPQLYARYVAALRTYKSQKHSIVYGWFDNSSKQPISRAQHIASVPDSMDIVSLLHPDALADWETAEFAELHTKGTKVIFTFSYADILTAYQATLPPAPKPQAEGGEEEPADGFLPFLSSQTDAFLALVDKYGYDGVAVFYEPRPLLYLAPAEKVIEQARQQAFTAKLSAWHTAHASKLFVFEGKPQDLADKSILEVCDYIVVRAFGATSHALLGITVRKALSEGVPADRLLVGVQTLPLDEGDLITGRFSDVTGVLSLCAVTEAAKWVASPTPELTMAGLAVYNLQNDYYSPNFIHRNMREAIHIMNPSPKN